MAQVTPSIADLISNSTARNVLLNTGGTPNIVIRTAANATLCTIPFTPTAPNGTTGVVSAATLPVSATASASGTARNFEIRNGAGTVVLSGIAGKFAFTVDDGTDVITATGHDFANAERVKFATTGTLPAPLSNATEYFVIDSTTDTFKVSLTSGGAAVDITTTGTGAFFVFRASCGLTIPAIISSGDIVQIQSFSINPDINV